MAPQDLQHSGLPASPWAPRPHLSVPPVNHPAPSALMPRGLRLEASQGHRLRKLRRLFHSIISTPSSVPAALLPGWWEARPLSAQASPRAPPATHPPLTVPGCSREMAARSHSAAGGTARTLPYWWRVDGRSQLWKRREESGIVWLYPKQELWVRRQSPYPGRMPNSVLLSS